MERSDPTDDRQSGNCGRLLRALRGKTDSLKGVHICDGPALGSFLISHSLSGEGAANEVEGKFVVLENVQVNGWKWAGHCLTKIDGARPVPVTQDDSSHLSFRIDLRQSPTMRRPTLCSV